MNKKEQNPKDNTARPADRSGDHADTDRPQGKGGGQRGHPGEDTAGRQPGHQPGCQPRAAQRARRRATGVGGTSRWSPASLRGGGGLSAIPTRETRVKAARGPATPARPAETNGRGADAAARRARDSPQRQPPTPRRREARGSGEGTPCGGSNPTPARSPTGGGGCGGHTCPRPTKAGEAKPACAAGLSGLGALGGIRRRHRERPGAGARLLTGPRFPVCSRDAAVFSTEGGKERCARRPRALCPKDTRDPRPRTGRRGSPIW